MVERLWSSCFFGHRRLQWLVARNQVIVHSKANAKKSSNNFPYDSGEKSWRAPVRLIDSLSVRNDDRR